MIITLNCRWHRQSLLNKLHVVSHNTYFYLDSKTHKLQHWRQWPLWALHNKTISLWINWADYIGGCNSERRVLGEIHVLHPPPPASTRWLQSTTIIGNVVAVHWQQSQCCAPAACLLARWLSGLYCYIAMLYCQSRPHSLQYMSNAHFID